MKINLFDNNTLIGEYQHKCKEDIERMIKVCKEYGFEITPYEADVFWCNFSDRVYAGWLSLPNDDDELVFILKDEFIRMFESKTKTRRKK